MNESAIDRAAEVTTVCDFMHAADPELKHHNNGFCRACAEVHEACNRLLLALRADQAVLDAAEAETAAEERWGQWGSPKAFKAKLNARRDRIAAVRARREAQP